MRQIDADALKEVFIQTLENIKSNPRMTGQEMHIITAIHTVGQMIDDAPTIDAVPEWIPFKARELTDEEKEAHPEWDFIFDGKLPENGQRILVSIDIAGHERVQLDEFYDDDGIYLDSGYEIGEEAVAWMPLPRPYEAEK